MQSRTGQNVNETLIDEFGNEIIQQQILTSIGENNASIHKQGSNIMNKGLNYIKQVSNTHSSNNTGSRAQSHTNHI
jgi:hypothetical protein